MTTWGALCWPSFLLWIFHCIIWKCVEKYSHFGHKVYVLWKYCFTKGLRNIPMCRMDLDSGLSDEVVEKTPHKILTSRCWSDTSPPPLLPCFTVLFVFIRILFRNAHKSVETHENHLNESEHSLCALYLLQQGSQPFRLCLTEAPGRRRVGKLYTENRGGCWPGKPEEASLGAGRPIWLIGVHIWLSLVVPTVEVEAKLGMLSVINQVLDIFGQLLQKWCFSLLDCH